MQFFFFSFLIISFAMAGLAAGLFLGRGALRGSCGGLNLADGTRIDCGGCPRRRKCERSANTDNREAGKVPAGVSS